MLRMLYVAAQILLFPALLAPPAPAAATSTVIDVLSREPRFSSLLHALQKARLVPYLNNSTAVGRTIFAPDNDAFDKRNDSWHGVARELLLYHVVPSTVRLEDLTDGHLLKTSLAPNGSLDPHDEGQRLKVTRRNDGPVLVGKATLLQGDLTADNGVVHVVDSLLDTPVDVVKTLSRVEGIATLNSAIDSSGFIHYLPSALPRTVFAPVDSAFDDIPPLTRQYLATTYAKSDLHIILKYHTHPGAYYMDELPEGTSSIPTLAGGAREISKAKQRSPITYDRLQLLKTDIVASNGAVHLIPKINFPSSFEMNALKYLVGMNRTKFVDLFIKAGLTRYLTRHSPASPITVFTAANEAMDDSAASNTDQLLYHVVPGRYELDDLRDNDVLRTALKTRLLRGQAQVLQLEIKENGADRDVLINDARIIGEPVMVEGAVIYTISHMLSLPPEPLQVILPDLNLSTFAAAVQIAGLERDVRMQPGTTIFVPSNDAFKKNSALMSYLLLPNVSADLQAVVEFHIATRALYAADLPRTGKGTSDLSIATLSGQNVTLRGSEKEGNLELFGSQPYAARFSGYPPRNRLTANGNIFVIDRVMLPDIDITIRNLLNVLNAPTFLQLVSDYLTGDASVPSLDAPRESPITVLVPSESAFTHVDLDVLLSDPARMTCSVKIHFVRGRAELVDGGVWDTFCDEGWIKVQSVSEDEWALEVVDKSGQAVGPKVHGRARVKSRGEARNGNVYEVNRFLHLPVSHGLAWYWILLIVLGCVGLIGAGFALWRYVQLRRRRAGYEAVSEPE